MATEIHMDHVAGVCSINCVPAPDWSARPDCVVGCEKAPAHFGACVKRHVHRYPENMPDEVIAWRCALCGEVQREKTLGDAPSAARPDTAQADTAVDTDRYRDGLHRWCIEKQTYNSGDPCMTCGTILLLCSAVDSLRAQLSAAQEMGNIASRTAGQEADRAERAEAALERVRALCDGERYQLTDTGDQYVRVADVRAALDRPDERPAKDGA